MMRVAISVTVFAEVEDESYVGRLILDAPFQDNVYSIDITEVEVLDD